jgi:hypothetical protein
MLFWLLFPGSIIKARRTEEKKIGGNIPYHNIKIGRDRIQVFFFGKKRLDVHK